MCEPMLHMKIVCLVPELILYTKMCKAHFSFTFSEFGPVPIINDICQFHLLDHVNIKVYYILNKEIQEFLVKMKMLFLRNLEIFISSREINLCRLDTFPSMVANRPVMYNRVPAF